MDDAAWGGDADPTLLNRRTRTLIAREVGPVHYGLSFRSDSKRVMTSVFGSRAGVDRTSGPIPIEELTPRNPDLITGAHAWDGTGGGATEVFEVGPGPWEYCASIVDGGIGLRASLYTEGGLWLTSISGAGSSGTLACHPLPDPGRYEIHLYTAPAELEWELVVGAPGVVEEPDLRLPAWSTNGSVRLVPSKLTDRQIAFDEPHGGFTPWFRPASDTWTI